MQKMSPNLQTIWWESDLGALESCMLTTALYTLENILISKIAPNLRVPHILSHARAAALLANAVTHERCHT